MLKNTPSFSAVINFPMSCCHITYIAYSWFLKNYVKWTLCRSDANYVEFRINCGTVGLVLVNSIIHSDYWVFIVVKLLSCVQFFVTPWTAARWAPQSFTVSWSLLKLLSIESLMLFNHLILCCPLLLPSIFPSIRIFSSELALGIRWPNYWRFSFSISDEYSGLISFKSEWFDLLAVQGTLRSLLQHHSLKASVLRCSAFFMIQHSYLYMTTGKTIALTVWAFVGKVMCLLFNMLSRLVIAFLPRNKYLLIPWL